MRLKLAEADTPWFTETERECVRLADFEAVLMRKDPPFDIEYVAATWLLEQAEREGARVFNRPRALRDHSEKLVLAEFAHLAPPSLVTRDTARIDDFIECEKDVILKPLDGMGGRGIFRVRRDDPNRNAIIEALSGEGRNSIMAQCYLPAIAEGDKRILLIDGEPIPYALARIPQAGETRANLAAGGRGEGVPLTERDRWICEQVAPRLREMGLLFVGLDVIGDWLTEINVTSPTCARELDAQFGLDIGGELMAAIERRLRR